MFLPQVCICMYCCVDRQGRWGYALRGHPMPQRGPEASCSFVSGLLAPLRATMLQLITTLVILKLATTLHDTMRYQTPCLLRALSLQIAV